MKKVKFLILCISVITLISCSSTNIYPSIEQKYASQLSQIHRNMTVSQVQALLPIRKHSAEVGDREVYVLRDFAGLHQTFADKTTNLFGVSVQDRPEMRNMYFYFHQGRLKHWNTGKQ